MNNKGQTLVVFILLLPIMVLLLAFVINEGHVYIEKRAVENNVKDVINYRFKLDENDEETYDKIHNYLHKNIKNITFLEIKLDNNYIKITINVNVSTELPMIIKKSSYEISNTYIGHMSDGQVIISKE